MRGFIGADPGGSGGVALIDETGKLVFVSPWPEGEFEQFEAVKKLQCSQTEAVVERVGAMPGQGVSSTFKFGKSYGQMRMALVAAGIGFRDITPRTWQLHFGMKKDKNESNTQWKARLKALAQQFYPKYKITNKTADAILMARYTYEVNR